MKEQEDSCPLSGHTLSMNAVGRGKGKKGSKSAVTMYCLNAVGRGEGVKKGPKIAVILKVSSLEENATIAN